MPDSICPKGWELPRYSDDKSFYKLLVNVYGQRTGSGSDRNGDKGIFQFPLNFIRTGVYDYGLGARYYRGSAGYYWESRIYNSTNARRLVFDFKDLHPQESYSKGHGLTIRCVSK